MKLPNFLDDSNWNTLRNNMKAELISLAGVGWKGIDTDDLFSKLNTSGVDVSFEEIELSDDGTFTYQGHKVLVYIRDQRFHPHRDGAEKEYKFHICNCKTISDFANRNQLDRYVVSRRTDGKFLVNIFNVLTRQYDQKGIYKDMNVCKNCLMALSYHGYANHSQDVSIYKDFDLQEFFDEFKSSQFNYTPSNFAETAPEEGYTDNFAELSRAIRRSNNWHCSICNIDLTNDKGFLHVHHKNGIKSDNSLRNLESICIGCHAEQPGHERMSFALQLNEFRSKYGAMWRKLKGY